MRSKYLKSFLDFFSANFAARLISLIREILLARFLGPSKILDIYFFIIAVPEFVNQIWNRPLETVLLKKYATYLHGGTIEIAKKNLSSHFAALFVVSFILYFLVSLIFPFIIYFFYKDFFSIYLVGSIFLINFALVIETSILAVKVVKYSENNFFIPSIIPIFQSLTMVAGIIFWEEQLSLIKLSFLFSMGSFLQLTILFKKEFKFVVYILFRKSKIVFENLILKNTAQLSLAAGLSSINVIVDQAFALNLGEAANSYIHYGYYFLTIYSFLIVRNLNTILFPQFQKYIVEKNYDKLFSDIQKMVKITLTLSIVSSVFLFNNGHFVLKLLIGHGKVTNADLVIIYYCTLAYAGAFLGTALNAILVRVLHVYNEYNLIIAVAVINLTVNIIFNYIFIIFFGVWGIALSTSLSFFVIIIIYFVFLSRTRKIKFFYDRKWYKKFIAFFVIVITLEYGLFSFVGWFINQSLQFNVITFIVTLFLTTLLLLIFKLFRFRDFKL